MRVFFFLVLYLIIKHLMCLVLAVHIIMLHLRPKQNTMNSLPEIESTYRSQLQETQQRIASAKQQIYRIALLRISVFAGGVVATVYAWPLGAVVVVPVMLLFSCCLLYLVRFTTVVFIRKTTSKRKREVNAGVAGTWLRLFQHSMRAKSLLTRRTAIRTTSICLVTPLFFPVPFNRGDSSRRTDFGEWMKHRC